MQHKTTPDHRAKKVYEENPSGGYSLYTRGSTAWVCRYVGSDGVTRWPTLKTRRSGRTLNLEAARAEAAALARKRDDGEDVAPSNLTFDALAEQCFAAFETRVKSG